MNVGTLEIQLMADMAQLRRDMDDAKSSVGSAMADIEKTVGLAKTALVALAGVGSVAAFANIIKSSIDATGALKDLAIQTGASEAALGAFRSVGAFTETSLDAVAAAMNKLGKNMVGSTEDSKGAADAIKALGLDFNSFKALSPEDQMLAVATAMNTFADGSEKGAAAQALFGKQGATLLPFLKDLGDSADEITAKLDDNEKAYRATQAAMADAFGDNLTAIQRESNKWKKDLSEGMTPALYEASQAFLDVATETGGLTGEIRTLSRDGTIAEWSRMAITGVTYVMDAFSGLKAIVKSAGAFIAYEMAGAANIVSTAATAINQAAHGDFSAAMETMAAGVRQQKVIASEFATQLDETWGEKTLGAKLRERMTEIQSVGNETEAAKPKMDYSGVTAKNEAARKAQTESEKDAKKAIAEAEREAKKQEETYNKLTSEINSKVKAMEAEMGQSTKLTESQRLEIKLNEDLRTGVIKLDSEQEKNTRTQIANMRAVEEKKAAYDRDQKQTAENTRENQAYIDKLEKATAAVQADVDKQREFNATALLSKEQVAALSIQKDLDRAASLERRAAVLLESGADNGSANEMLRQSAALRELAGLKEQGIHVQAAREAQTAWEATTRSIATGLSSNLTSAVMEGRDIWRSFRDFMVSTIIDNVIKNALANQIAAGISGLTSGLTSAISAAFGSSVAGRAVTGGVTTGATVAGATVAGSTVAGATVAADVTAGMTGIASSTEAFNAALAASNAAEAAAVAESAGALYTTEAAAAAAAETAGVSGSLAAIPGYGWVALGVLALSQTGFGQQVIQGVSDVISDIGGGISDAVSSIGRVFGFAEGGDHAGGYRIVGENGPELEATGPSRIFNADQTRAILGGGGNAELLDELRLLRRAVEQDVVNSGRVARYLQQVTPSGDAIQTRAIA